MIFSSTPATGSPRHKGRGRYLAAGVGWGRMHSPNPILLRVREDNERAETLPRGLSLGTRVEMWLLSIQNLRTFGGFTSWDSTGHPRHILTTASEDETDHAYRVLDRLAKALIRDGQAPVPEVQAREKETK